MYQNLYDPNPKRFYTVKVNIDNNEDFSTKINQKGIREYLFCGDCESLLSKYENYSAETIYAKNKKNKAYLVKASETPDQQYFLYEWAGISYNEFKIFLLSIIYRIFISSTFYSPPVSDETLEKLRAAIHSETALDYDEFGCMIQIIKYKKSYIASGFILDPFVTRNENSDILNILVDGFMYSFFLDSKNVSEEIKDNFLKLDGKMNIVGRILFQDIGLFEKIKKAYDYFGYTNK
jgi:hypothetical protein